MISVTVYTEWAKNGTKFLYTNNFVKYKPIFNFFSLLVSKKNL